MGKGCKPRQKGMTLIEVLVSVLILAIGILGAAAIQLNALKYTDSSAMTSQASFIAYDMMDRIRANVDGNAAGNGANNVLARYSLSSLATAPLVGNLNDARLQDLFDFRTNIIAFAGADGASSNIVIAGRRVTFTIFWNDARAVGASDVALTGAATNGTQRSFVLTSQVGVDAVTP